MKKNIYYKERLITLKETDNLREDFFDDIEFDDEYDEPFLHKCNERMKNILDVFFQNENPKEISFEYSSLKKLYKDFKSHFKFIKAAGGIVVNDKGKLLVIERNGITDLPKGKVEKGESIKEAAIREVKEECGINNLIIKKKAKPSYHIFYKNHKRILKKTYWFYMEYHGNEKPVPQTAENISSVKWCNKKSVHNLSKKTYRSLKKYFENF